MGSIVDFAVPGLMQPGAAQPGEPGSALVPVPVSLLITTGQPYLQWTTGPVTVG